MDQEQQRTKMFSEDEENFISDFLNRYYDDVVEKSPAAGSRRRWQLLKVLTKRMNETFRNREADQLFDVGQLHDKLTKMKDLRRDSLIEECDNGVFIVRDDEVDTFLRCCPPSVAKSPAVSAPIRRSNNGDEEQVHQVVPAGGNVVENKMRLNVTPRCQIYCQRNSELTSDEAMSILLDPDVSKVSTAPPMFPRGNEIYVYLLDRNASAERAKIRCDRYMWNNCGSKGLRNQIKKSYWTWRTEGGTGDAAFRRQEYRLEKSTDQPSTENTSNKSVIIMQYLGDETITTPRPHGNSTKNVRPHIRNMPYVKEKILPLRELDNAEDVYRDLVKETVPGQYAAVMLPRDLTQVHNTQKNARLAHRISHDALYSVVLLSKQLPDFVHYFKILDGFSLVLANKELIGHLGTAIEIAAMGEASMFQLQYDTTFNMGDFYVSPLLLRYQIFEGNPSIPVAFHIHEYKHIIDHRFAFDILKNICKPLANKRFPIVTDREFNVADFLPNAVQLYCWNHLKRNVRRELHNQGGNSEQVNFLVDQFSKLIDSETLEEFQDQYNKAKLSWPEAYARFFERHLVDDIEKRAGRWVLEPLGLYFPRAGITINAAEGLNALLKRFVHHKEMPIDAFVLCLFRLQQYYSREITRGMHGLGQYRLKPDYSFMQKASEDMPTLEATMTPEEIVDSVKGDIVKELSAPDTTVELDGATVKDGDAGAHRIQLSQVALAREAVENNTVVHVPGLKAFMVKGTDIPRTVTLYPNETCSCPATKTCYHIMAAKISIGMPVGDPSGKINLTMVKKRNFKRTEKKSGRKQYRKVDVADREVVPAVDSILGQSYASGDGNEKNDVSIQEKIEPIVFVPTLKTIEENDVECADIPCARDLSTITTSNGKRNSSTPKKHNQSVYCICRMPYDGKAKMVECGRCFDWFHTECVMIPDEAVDNVGVHWTCDTCFTSAPGWGGDVASANVRFVNTCPLDSVLIILTKAGPNLIRKLPNTAAGRALKEALNYFNKSEYSLGKFSWAKFLERSKSNAIKRTMSSDNILTYNLYGDPFDVFLASFTELWTLEYQVTCSASRCPQKNKKKSLCIFSLCPMDNFIIPECLSRYVDAGGKCGVSRRGNGVCNGSITASEPSFRSSAVFLPIGLQGFPLAAIKAVPKTFCYSGKKFQLGGITLHSARRQHFEAVIPRYGNWYHYDGYRPLSRIDEDFIENNRDSTLMPNCALYILSN